MGDIVVDYFQETLYQLLSSFNLDFNKKVKYQLLNLYKGIKYLREFLKATETKRNSYPEVMKLVMEIRDVTCDADNIVDLFVPLVSKADHPSDSLCEYPDHLISLGLESVLKVIQNLMDEVKQIYDENKYDINGVATVILEHSSNRYGGRERGMGDTLVNWLLGTLHRLLFISDLHFNEEVKYRLHNLYEEMKYLREFLNVTEKQYKYPEVKKLVTSIRNVTAYADSVVKRFKTLVPYQDSDFLHLERVEKAIQSIMDEVKQIYDEKMYGINGVATEILEHSSNRKGGGSGSSGGLYEELIGFDDDYNKLAEIIFHGGFCGDLQVISIEGRAGGGKTTLAREMYHRMMDTFEICAWVVVSPDYNKTMKRDLLIGILKSTRHENYDDYGKSNDQVLEKMVYQSLKGKKYLLVMDDIWDKQAWNDISRSLPKERKYSMVIFTSRQPVKVDGCHLHRHYLCSLSEIHSWELLEKKVFGEKRCPPELIKIGKQIAEKCDGLPLAIIAAAGILANEEKTLNAWKKIAEQLNSTIAKRHEGIMEILELSYNHLPLSLKACFLYIGGHPKDYEIPVHELIWLWIAEGFIQQNGEGKSLEAIAEDYLGSLVERNLVMVARKGNYHGGMKSCRIHNLLHELCLKKVKEDNFIVQIDEDDSSAFSAINKHSRLFVFRQFFMEFFSSRPYPQNLRSFLCLGSRHSRIELHISFFAETFKLLRVFSFILDECRGEILRGQLVHLRYLALQLSENADFRFPFHLVKLETLIVQTSSFKEIKLSSNILKMVKLRHLYSKQGMFMYHVSCVKDEGNTLDSLQTLHKMCICNHCLRFLKKTPNLRKLGLIRDPDTKGDDVLMLPNLKFLKCLEILYVESTSVARTGLKLPSTLTKLTLCHTKLQWEELSKILLTLPRLEFLSLKDACSGPLWDESELVTNVFYHRLKYLRLKDLDIEEWRVSRCNLWRLEILVIQDCRKLKGISIRLGYLEYLREFKVERSSRSAEDSARKIWLRLRGSRKDHDCPNLVLSCNSS